MLSAWPAASMTTRAPKMVSGIPSVAAVGKARGHSGHAETVSHGWEGFRLRIKHFLHTCACTKGSVTQNFLIDISANTATSAATGKVYEICEAEPPLA